ncbi:mitochondrial ribosomal protein L46 [Rhynchophorus ferrugineus]|uniref:Large ribosomal subunit protein mL46 n=1 Tax=Rhynchophorus ferrugineus TaxID=354439 RepID=A0A834MCS4_RHYFE|nr:hypothetical protein GWI33_006672 [Rhynchophorus ferrugineus]
MFRNTLRLVQTTRNILIINKANLKTCKVLREKWDLLTAVVIERKPIISPALNDLEKAFQDYLSEVEFERSLKNNTEIKLEKEKSFKPSELEDIDQKATQNVQDFIDLCKEELSQFKSGERITVADKSNDKKSLNRKLEKYLVLVVNQKLGNQNYFILPQGERQDGETLRQCAERVLKEKCGNNIKAQIYGNIPCGFYKYRYPKEIISKKGSIGAKIFFYYARYTSGQTTECEYQWLDKSELQQILPEKYKKSLLPILFD